MSIFSILQTPKGSDNAKLIGQTTDTSPANARNLAEKATGETPTGMTVIKGETLTVNTASNHIDFVDRNLVAQVYGRVIAFLLFAALATALPAQTQQAQPKPHTCTFYNNTMTYCGAKSWKSASRCKKHRPREMQRRAAAYSKMQSRRKNH